MVENSFQTQVTLDQWAAIVAVVDAGGLHAAGRRLGRSHSAVGQAVRKAEDRLGVVVFVKRGRSLVLTEAGEVVVRRAREVLATAAALEADVRLLADGWEGEVTLVVDGLVPPAWLGPRLVRFGDRTRTRLRIRHEVMRGAIRSVEERTADVVLTGMLPLGAAPNPVFEVAFRPVVAPGLAEAVRDGRPLSALRQLVVADTGASDDVQGWLRAEDRWTCPTFDVAVDLARQGLGFCIAPVPWVADELRAGRLVALDDPERSRKVQVHLCAPRGDGTGPAARCLIACLEEP